MMTMGKLLIVSFYCVKKGPSPQPDLLVNPDYYCEKTFTNFLTFDHINDGALMLQFDK